jgi:magnesium-transporting ATPase (P-type)
MKYIIMGTSSNFGNMFSMAAASLFLPFLPTQILLNNFLYDLSQINIPSDNVDPALLHRPKRWQIGFIRQEFMMIIGPISSIYDFLTFGVLLWVFHASTNAPLFHTGWFVESLATQTLVVFVIRTAGNSVQEPCRPPVVDRRVGGRCYRRCAAVHTGPEPAGIYAAAVVALGCDCRIGSRLPSGGASRQVLVLSTTCAALSHPNHHLPEATVTGTATMTRGE